MKSYENFKEVEVKGRKFVIRKFDARTGSFMLIKVTGLIGPMLKGLDISKVKVDEGKMPDVSGIDIAGMVSGLSTLKEEDFNYIHDKCLQICFENLPAGPTQVMNMSGNFGVSDLDTDSATTLALVAHTLIFNVTGFFGGSPLGSILGGLLGTKLPDAKM
jgi:hypothetical protein